MSLTPTSQQSPYIGSVEYTWEATMAARVPTKNIGQKIGVGTADQNVFVKFCG